VVGEVEEDLIGGGGLEDLWKGGGGLTLEDGEVVDWVDSSSGIVDDTPGVDVGSIGLVVELTWERVAWVIGDIIVGEVDDFVGLVTGELEDLVGVARVGLMSVVPVSVGSGDDDGPVRGLDGGDCESN
jgi:hypothetical protein